MEPFEEPVLPTEPPPKRPLIFGAVVGGIIGAVFGVLITLLNLGGKGDWTLAVPGMIFNGLFLGLVVGAIVREARGGKGGRGTEQGRLRVILMWAAFAVILVMAGMILFLHR